MLKRLTIIALALILLILPVAIRWLYFYEGRYEPAEVSRPDLTQIQVPTRPAAPYTGDEPTSQISTAEGAALGTIVIDLAHGNRFATTELNVLQSRLAARGQRMVHVRAADELGRHLRNAPALIVISPGEDWTPDQIQLVQAFVGKGGRLLLVGDPTRYAVEYDEFDNPVIDEDVSHLNDLAGRFGLFFQPDYLYNTSDNAGNFRNINLNEFVEHPLTEGLQQVVFYAARSIVSEGSAVITAGSQTRSSDQSESGASGLSVAVVSADGNVLGLGDFTFMTEPYNADFDNDRLVANIADFLSSGQRGYRLTDFPFFFSNEAHLIYAGDPMLDSDLLKGGSTLQTMFADEGKALVVREAEDMAVDTLFFGLYQKAADVAPYLEAAGITLSISPTSASAKPSGTVPPTRVGNDGTPAAEASAQNTDSLAGAQTTPTAPATTAEPPDGSLPTTDHIRIESVGDMVITGTLLLSLQTENQRQVMVMLSDTEDGLRNGIERLTKGDLSGCILREKELLVTTMTMDESPTLVALCPTGEVAEGDGSGGWQDSKEEPPPPNATPTVTTTVEPSETEQSEDKAAKKILIVALDKGEGKYVGMTSADQYAAILQAFYDVTIWSQAREGLPPVRTIREYDLTIWTSGDFQEPLGEEGSNSVFLTMLEGIPVILSGAYITEADTQSVQTDIQVKDVTHPIARGLKATEVIPFVTTPSGEEYEIDLLEAEGQNQVVVFVRGPESEDAGAPSVYTFEEESSGVRVVVIGFPFYLLPDQTGSLLALNSVEWLLGSP